MCTLFAEIIDALFEREMKMYGYPIHNAILKIRQTKKIEK